jgi:hypothetical protein
MKRPDGPLVSDVIAHNYGILRFLQTGVDENSPEPPADAGYKAEIDQLQQRIQSWYDENDRRRVADLKHVGGYYVCDIEGTRSVDWRVYLSVKMGDAVDLFEKVIKYVVFGHVRGVGAVKITNERYAKAESPDFIVGYVGSEEIARSLARIIAARLAEPEAMQDRVTIGTLQLYKGISIAWNTQLEVAEYSFSQRLAYATANYFMEPDRKYETMLEQQFLADIAYYLKTNKDFPVDPVTPWKPSRGRSS